jgi:hypothetical protein
MNFLGLFSFNAPYLPWVLIGFSLLLHGVWPAGDLVGLVVGHIYYFLDDVWPRGGRFGGELVRPRYLRAPQVIKDLFEGWMRDRNVAALPERYAEMLGQNENQENQGQGEGAEQQDFVGVEAPSEPWVPRRETVDVGAGGTGNAESSSSSASASTSAEQTTEQSSSLAAPPKSSEISSSSLLSSSTSSSSTSTSNSDSTLRARNPYERHVNEVD